MIFILTFLSFFHVKHYSPRGVNFPRFDRGIVRRKSGGLNDDDAGGLIRDDLR